MLPEPKARILIVDDEATPLQALCDTLRHQGYETTGCATGEAALAAMQEAQFDILLSDLMMPHMNGVELLTRALGIDPQLVGILMTGKGTIETAVQAMKAGALDYVLKPIRLSAIAPVLERAVGIRRLRQENLELRNTVAIHELTQAIAHTLDPGILLDKIADTALAEFDADEASVMLVTDDGQSLYIAAVRGAQRSALLGKRLPIGGGIAGIVAMRQQPLVLEGDLKQSQWTPLHPRSEIVSALSMPMVTRGRLIGVLNVNSTRRRGAFPPGQVKMLSIFTSAAAAALDAARSYENQRKADARYREVVEMADDGILSIDEAQRVTMFNAGAEDIFGYRAGEVTGQPLELLLPEGLADVLGLHMRSSGEGTQPPRVMAEPLLAQRKNGTRFHAEVVISNRHPHNGVQHTVVVRDVTQRVQQETKIRRLTRIQRVLSSINSAIVRIHGRQQLIEEVCRIAVDHGGLGVAWIGMLNPETLDIIPSACAGVASESLMATSHNSARADSPYGQGLVGRALREKRATFSNDLVAEAGSGGVRRQEAIRRGYNSLIVVPLLVGDTVVGCLSLLARERNFFTEEEVALLNELAGNVSFGLEYIRQAEALAESERKLDSILDTLQEVVWSMEPHSCRLLYLNAAAQLLTRRPNSEFLSRPRLWRRLVHRDDRAALRQAVRGLLRDGRMTHEFRIVLFGSADDAGECVVELNASVRRDDEGRILSIDGTLSDITERKRAEEAVRREQALLRAIVDAIPERIYVKDRAGRFLLQNSTNLTTHGIASLEGILGKTVFDMFPAETAERMHAEDEAVMVAGQPALNRERRTIYSDPRAAGEATQWHLSSKVPLRDQKGVVYGLVGIIRDITELKQAESALRRLNEELEDKVAARTYDLERARHEAEDANLAKSSFLATMSHEIRTPMNGVVGMIEVLHQTSLKGDQVEMVELIRESAFSLLTIINDILDFSKIEAGKLELEHEPFSVEDVAERVCGLLNNLAYKKGVALTLYTDPQLPALVLGDALRLRQVLVNLVNNAIKFSGGRDDGGRVSLRAVLIERGTKTAFFEIQVTDDGIGMDRETQNRLFTAFTQADASTTRRFGGTGLGLAIAEHLMRLMGGEIVVTSAPGAGATFRVRLSAALAEAGGEQPVPLPDVSGLHCVVIGDRESMVNDLAEYLRHARAIVARAAGLREAGESHAPNGGRSVWVIDCGEEEALSLQSRTLADDTASAGVQRVYLVIARGKRRRPRILRPGMVLIDGNALTRRGFLKAVSVAAGRASLEAEEVSFIRGKGRVVAPSRDEALRRGQLILIAEDNDTNQKVIVQQLALLGYTADVAGNGRDALARWQNGSYALLLTDLHMPEMDGYDLTEAIRALEKGGQRMPIIALTANALKGEAERCLAIGMDGYQSKPTPLTELKAMLEKWLPANKSTEAPAASAATSIATSVATSVGTSIATSAAAAATAAAPAGTAAGASVIDVHVLEALVGNEPEVVREFLNDFRRSAAGIVAEVRAAYAARQPAAVAAAAHKLKSSARAVGAHALGETCAELEQHAQDGALAAIGALMPRFDREVAAVEDYLDGL